MAIIKCRMWIWLTGFLLLPGMNLDAQEPTLARLSFWAPPERMKEFEAEYQAQVLPLIKKHGLVEASESGRAVVDSVFSRLFEFETLAELEEKQTALADDPVVEEALKSLGAAFWTPSSKSEILVRFRHYAGPAGAGKTVPAGPGKTKTGTGRTVQAGAGTWQGVWQTLGVPDGLPTSHIYATHQDRAGNLWFSTEGAGVCRYDGNVF